MTPDDAAAVAPQRPAPPLVAAAMALACASALAGFLLWRALDTAAVAQWVPVRFLVLGLAACWFVKWRVAAVRRAAPAGRSRALGVAALLTAVLGGTALLVTLHWIVYALLRMAALGWLGIAFDPSGLALRVVVEIMCMGILAFRMLTTRWATGHPAGGDAASAAIAWLAVSGFGLTGWVLMAFTWMPAASYAIAWLQRAGLGIVVEAAVVLAFYRLAFWQEDKARFEAMGAPAAVPETAPAE